MRGFTAGLIVLTGLFVNIASAREPYSPRFGNDPVFGWSDPLSGPYGDYRSNPAQLSGQIQFDPYPNSEPLAGSEPHGIPRYRASKFRSEPVPPPARFEDSDLDDLSNNPADPGCDRPYCCGGRFLSTRFGVLVMQRMRPSNEALFFDAFAPTQVVNAQQFDPGWATGVDVSLMLHDWQGRDTDLEARFFGVDDWSSVQTLTTTGASVIINNNPPTAIVGPRTITSDFSSNLFSREIISHAWNEDRTFGYLFGGRMIQLNEDLNTLFIPDPAAGLADIRYDVATRNYLYGGQIGLEFALVRNCFYCWDGYVKGALMANYASNQSVATTFVAPPVTFPVNNNDWNLAYIAEVGVNGRHKLTEHWSLSLGYQVLYVSGVALATEQIRSTDVGSRTGLNTDAAVFYHGGRLGLEYNF